MCGLETTRKSHITSKIQRKLKLSQKYVYNCSQLICNQPHNQKRTLQSEMLGGDNSECVQILIKQRYQIVIAAILNLILLGAHSTVKRSLHFRFTFISVSRVVKYVIR